MMSEKILFQVKNLSKTYGKQQAVKNVSFQVEKRTCMAIIGPNGAGKTTILKMLAGLLIPTAGTITFPGKEIKDKRQLIGFLPQHPSFFSWMSAKDFLLFTGRLSGLSKSRLAVKVDEMLNFVGLYEVRNKKISGFSGGMKQRLGLAQALIHEPELLILDEPVSALDPNGRRDVLKLLHTLKSKTAVLFSTHVLHDAEQVCDSVMMLKKGEIKWSGSLTELQQDSSTTVIKIKTAEPLEHCFSGLPKLEHIEYKDLHTAVLHFAQPTFDSHDLLKLLIEKNLSLLHFEHVQDSLEEAYLKVMNS